MQEIERLRQEIQSFEVEIKRLEQELSAVGGRTLELASTESNALVISKTIRAEAQRLLDQQPVIRGLRDAIAELNSHLQPKKLQLQELEAQQLRQHRLEQIDEGRSKLRAKFGDVEQAAESLKNLFFELKAIAREYEGDFAQIHLPTPVRRELNTASLLNFGLLTVPELIENDGRFLVKSKPFDVFQVEKQQAKAEQLARSQAYRQDRELQWAQIKEREIEQRSQIERQERKSLLINKQSELAEFQAARTERLSSLASANVNYFDDAIAKLKEEIETLDKIKQE